MKQADYDLKSAEIMLDGKRYIYTIFLCHLCLEKALKGIYAQQHKKDPPRIHSLEFLVKETGLELSQSQWEFIDNLNDISVPTRYPEELDDFMTNFSGKESSDIMKKTKEMLSWLKEKL